MTSEIILEALQVRFSRDVIYTYVGEMLVAVNPLKPIHGLYDAAAMQRYTAVGAKHLLPPHIFAISDVAFAQMVSSGKDQVCVISGELGAGKTESAKLFTKQLVQVAKGGEIQGLEQRLIEVSLASNMP